MTEIGFDGYALGGLSVGESKEEMYYVLDYVAHELPAATPRYLMGVGEPEDLLAGIEAGIDMFDCCLLYTSPSPRDRQKSRMPSSA